MFSLQVTMFIICSHIHFLVSCERFIMSCLFLSQCSLFLFFFLFGCVLFSYWSLKDKNTASVSGLQERNRSFMSRWTFLITVNAFSFTSHVYCFCFPLPSHMYAPTVRDFWDGRFSSVALSSPAHPSNWLPVARTRLTSPPPLFLCSP